MSDKIYDQREDLYAARKAAELDKMRAVKAWDDSAEITRLRAELARVREAGKVVVEIAGEETHDPCLDLCLANLKAALEGGENTNDQ